MDREGAGSTAARQGGATVCAVVDGAGGVLLRGYIAATACQSGTASLHYFSGCDAERAEHLCGAQPPFLPTFHRHLCPVAGLSSPVSLGCRLGLCPGRSTYASPHCRRKAEQNGCHGAKRHSRGVPLPRPGVNPTLLPALLQRHLRDQRQKFLRCRRTAPSAVDPVRQHHGI